MRDGLRIGGESEELRLPQPSIHGDVFYSLKTIPQPIGSLLALEFLRNAVVSYREGVERVSG